MKSISFAVLALVAALAVSACSASVKPPVATNGWCNELSTPAERASCNANMDEQLAAEINNGN